MGCDIHGVVQRKWNDSKGWETIGLIDDERHYLLFSFLAGVRNYDELKPISEPRGYPHDFSAVDDEHNWEDSSGNLLREWMGDHSHSWLMLEEIEGWPGWTNEMRANCETFLTWLRWIRLRHGGAAGVRIVFGFDN